MTHIVKPIPTLMNTSDRPYQSLTPKPYTRHGTSSDS